VNPGTRRQRRLRERRASGVAAVVPIEVSRQDVEALIVAGHLTGCADGAILRVNKKDVPAAVRSLLDSLFAPQRSA